MTMESSTLRRRGAYALEVASDLAARAARRVATRGEALSGDRWVEWGFVFARLADGPGRTLDFGADIGFLSFVAAERGNDVVAFDRMPSTIEYAHPRVRVVRGDVLAHNFGAERFDQILNCSSVEHVGLPGRYGSFDHPDGDLEAMTRLRAVLTEGGRMILTVPVGRDLVCAPRHRIYGEQRLPRLLEGYGTAEEQFWHKVAGRWQRTDRMTALATEGSESFYALGLFVLTAER